jgi:hypothetical protein
MSDIERFEKLMDDFGQQAIKLDNALEYGLTKRVWDDAGDDFDVARVALLSEFSRTQAVLSSALAFCERFDRWIMRVSDELKLITMLEFGEEYRVLHEALEAYNTKKLERTDE